MGPFFPDLPVIDQNDPVRIAYRRKAMGDDDRRPAFRQFIERSLDPGLRHCIQR